MLLAPLPDNTNNPYRLLPLTISIGACLSIAAGYAMLTTPQQIRYPIHGAIGLMSVGLAASSLNFLKPETVIQTFCVCAAATLFGILPVQYSNNNFVHAGIGEIIFIFLAWGLFFSSLQNQIMKQRENANIQKPMALPFIFLASILRDQAITGLTWSNALAIIMLLTSLLSSYLLNSTIPASKNLFPPDYIFIYSVYLLSGISWIFFPAILLNSIRLFIKTLYNLNGLNDSERPSVMSMIFRIPEVNTRNCILSFYLPIFFSNLFAKLFVFNEPLKKVASIFGFIRNLQSYIDATPVFFYLFPIILSGLMLTTLRSFSLSQIYLAYKYYHEGKYDLTKLQLYHDTARKNFWPCALAFEAVKASSGPSPVTLAAMQNAGKFTKAKLMFKVKRLFLLNPISDIGNIANILFLAKYMVNPQGTFFIDSNGQLTADKFDFTSLLIFHLAIGLLSLFRTFHLLLEPSTAWVKLRFLAKLIHIIALIAESASFVLPYAIACMLLQNNGIFSRDPNADNQQDSILFRVILDSPVSLYILGASISATLIISAYEYYSHEHLRRCNIQKLDLPLEKVQREYLTVKFCGPLAQQELNPPPPAYNANAGGVVIVYNNYGR